MDVPRIMVVDDNPVVRSGLVSLLEAAGMRVVGEAGDGASAVRLAEQITPDVVLLDVRMPQLDGVAAARAIAEHALVIMVTYTDQPEVVRDAIGNGAAGYLVHGTFTADDLITAVHDALNGTNPLSPPAVSALMSTVRRAPSRRTRFGLSTREAEVMDLVAAGRSNSEIARQLVLAEKTVKNHVNHIFGKLDVTTRAAAIARWIGTAQPGGLGPQAHDRRP
ncbi:MAG TPA: response regulator transcription factor [Streptosporangiaceae bacterium]